MTNPINDLASKDIVAGRFEKPGPTVFRCDVCGQFVAMSKAVRNLVTPLSEFTREEFETLCEEHGGRVSPAKEGSTCAMSG